MYLLQWLELFLHLVVVSRVKSIATLPNNTRSIGLDESNSTYFIFASSILCVLFLFACFIACLFDVYTIARVYENFKYYFKDFEIPILCTNIVVSICIFPTNTHNLQHANSTHLKANTLDFLLSVLLSNRSKLGYNQINLWR